MNRRNFVAALALPVVFELRRLLDGTFVNRGEVVAKRITGRRDGRRLELARSGAESRTVAPPVVDLLEGDGTGPLEVGERTARQLRSRFEDVELVVVVRHHDRSLSKPDDGEPVEYRTIRPLFDGLAVGDHAAFQTSLLRPRTLVSLSCVTADEATLRNRCGVSVEDPTEDA